jgi:16S rRNA (guanine966-N2)-methyltransferase
MRIISGKLKGRRIPPPEVGGVRPTSDRTKEAMFSILESRMHLDGVRVLDLFAGTGNLGFEALSRGCEAVMFVDQGAAVIKQIQRNADALGIASSCRFRSSDGASFIEQSTDVFDVVFADPPYDYPRMAELPDLLLDGGVLSRDGLFFLEHDRRITFEAHEKCVLSRPYGRTVVSVFSYEGAAAD